MDEDSSRNSDDDPLSSGSAPNPSSSSAPKLKSHLDMVEVRPLKANWVGIGCVAFYALMCFVPFGIWLFTGEIPQDGVRELVLLTALGFIPGIAAVIGALWMVRWRVVADEQGLRWRTTFHDWQSVRWDEISDFYSRFSSEKSGKRIEVGTKVIVLEGTNAEIVAGLVAERAVNAPFRGWQMRGTRPGEIFWHEMKAWSGRWWYWAAIGAAIVVLCAARLMMPSLSFNFWLWEKGPFALLLLPVGLLMLVTFASRFGQRFERLEVSERGLQLTTRHKEVFVAWGELEAIQKKRHHYVVRFAGDEMRMGSWLPTTRIQSYAQALASTARFESDVEGSSRSVTSEGVCFSHPRAILFSTAFYSLILVVAGVGGLGLILFLPAEFWEPNPAPRPVDFLPILLFAIPVGWLWLLYLRSAIIFREAGLEVRGVWRTRFYPWETLEFWRDDAGPRLEADGRKLTLLNDWKSSARELERELRVHLPERMEAS